VLLPQRKEVRHVLGSEEAALAGILEDSRREVVFVDLAVIDLLLKRAAADLGLRLGF
jgi:hypothetical protein